MTEITDMKRRTKMEKRRQQKRERRKANMGRSLGSSDYASKVKSGDMMYGPGLTQQEVSRRMGVKDPA